MEVFSSHVDKIRFYPEVLSVLSNLNKRYELIISSGIPSNLVGIAVRDFRHYFTHIFSPVTDLQQVGKTPDFYRMICKILKISPSNVIHVGDDLQYDFNIPKTLGITSYLIDRTGERTGEYVIKNLGELEDRLICR